MEISVKVHRRWKDEENLVKRIARIVCYDDSQIFQKDTGYKWQLNSGNDWWTSGLENGEIKVCYRYGTDELMKALKVFLDWSLG